MAFVKVVAAALMYINYYKLELMRALAIPFFLLVLIYALASFELDPFLDVAISILLLGVKVIFAIVTHRVLILGSGSVPAWGIMSWTKRETLFLLHVITLTVLMMAASAVILVSIPGFVVAWLVLCWALGRLSLVFPGLAVDKGVSFRLSWRLTKQHQVLMFSVVILFPILLFIPEAVLGIFVPDIFLFWSFLSALIIVLQVAALSMAYQFVCRDLYE